MFIFSERHNYSISTYIYILFLHVILTWLLFKSAVYIHSWLFEDTRIPCCSMLKQNTDIGCSALLYILMTYLQFVELIFCEHWTNHKDDEELSTTTTTEKSQQPPHSVLEPSKWWLYPSWKSKKNWWEKLMWEHEITQNPRKSFHV